MSLVSVIVPAHNAAGTIERTLESIRQQTHGDLQVIVVDDGSTDATAELAQGFASADPRFEVHRTPNRGVAAARNFAIDHARGDFIAPLDADDLWDPRKIALQLERLSASPGSVLAYNWFLPIDENDRINADAATPMPEGEVFHRHLDWNFISNGSTPLVVADVLRKVRYDPSLQLRGVHGCEDYLMQLQVARFGHFCCVPAFLTGYRKVGGSMSGNPQRMIRSHIAVLEGIASADEPEAQAIVRRRIAEFEVELARNRIRRHQWHEGARALMRSFGHSPKGALAHLWQQVLLMTRSRQQAHPAGEGGLIGASFPLKDPFAVTCKPLSRRRRKRLESLSALDGAGSQFSA